MALLLPNLRQVLKYGSGIKDGATRIAVTALEAWADELIRRLSKLEQSSGSGVAETRAINTTAPLTGGGDLSADRTLTVADNSTASKGVVAVAPNDTAQFWRGDASWGVTPFGATALAFGLGYGVNGGDIVDITLDGSAAPPGLTLAGTTYSLTGNRSFRNVHISAGYTLNPSAFILMVSGTLSGDGRIARNGNDGSSAGPGGAALSGATLPGSTVGGAGAINATSSAGVGGASTSILNWLVGGSTAGVSQAAGQDGTGAGHGGSGGGRRSGFSTGGASGGASGAGSGGFSDLVMPHCALFGRNVSGTASTGSMGGGGGASSDQLGGGWTGTDGGGGGSGGGMIVICAKNFTFTGSIEARGGSGADAVDIGPVNAPSNRAHAPSGGGGGGGGTVLLVIGTGTSPSECPETHPHPTTAPAGTVCVHGGNKGLGGTCLGDAVGNENGFDGGNGHAGRYFCINLSA